VPRKIIRRKLQLPPRTSQSITKRIDELKVTAGLSQMPSTSFALGVSGGKETLILKPVSNSAQTYDGITNSKNRPVYSVRTIAKYTYFFLEYDNIYLSKFDGYLNSFAIIKTLTPQSLKDVSYMLGKKVESLSGLSESEYLNSSFNHPKYKNQNGDPLQFRYSEISLVTQITPGRLDNVPLGYPDFDSTPSGVVTRRGPLPGPPIVDFGTATGGTAFVNIQAGGTVYFVDLSPREPASIRPLNWLWDFGPTASPTGSSSRTQIVQYGSTGSYTVELTAWNPGGTASKTKIGYVTVI
jgi:PKD repeat protein